MLTLRQVSVDNVSSQQMHEIRAALRGEAVVLMGKNTMVRRALKGFITDNPEFERLLPHVKGNIRIQEGQNYNALTRARKCRFHLHQRRSQDHP